MLEIFLGITTFICNSFLGVFVFFQNKKSWTNRLFFLLTVFINTYIFANYLSLHPPTPTPEGQLFWIRVVMVLTSLIGPNLFLLVHTFPYDKITLKKWKLVLVLTLAVFSAVASILPLVFTGIKYENGQVVPIPGPGMVLFVLAYPGLILLSFLLLIYKYFKSQGKEKKQNFFFMMGVASTFLSMAFFTVFLVIVLKISAFVFLGPYLTLLMIAFIAYAIVKHRFLDTRLLLVRTLAFSFLMFVIGTFYSTALISVVRVALGEEVSRTTLGITLLFTLITTFSFQFLQRFVERVTENVFYRHSYSRQALLESLTHIMASTLYLADLVEKVLQELENQMKISSLSVMLVNKDQVTFSKKIGNQNTPHEEDAKLIELIRFAYEKKEEKFVIFEELPESPYKDLMRAYGYSVIAALIVKGELLGGLFLREKNTGEIYSTQDIEVLKILVPEFAVAIQNAFAYEEIRNFNVTLEQEVLSATKKLREANEKLKELDKLKDEFVSIASHELRTPMGAIKSMISMILEGDYGTVVPEIRDPLIDINTSVERLINLVNSMLNISRIEAGRMKFSLEDFATNAFVEKILSSLEPLAKSRNIELKSEQLTEAVVQGDREKIEQVFNNLIGNSLKFTEDGGKITLSSVVKDQFLTFYVSDTGTGISEKDQKKLFGKFEQVTTEKIGKPVGTGLGLYISRELTRKMGGELWIDHSELGKGSTFAFSLPLAHSKKAEEVKEFIEKEAENHPDQK